MATFRWYPWEANTANPGIEYMPAIIRLLGYNPLLPANGWGARLGRHRTSLGLTQEEAARRISIDASTLAKLERGEKESAGILLVSVERLLCDKEAADLGARRVG